MQKVRGWNVHSLACAVLLHVLPGWNLPAQYGEKLLQQMPGRNHELLGGYKLREVSGWKIQFRRRECHLHGMPGW